MYLIHRRYNSKWDTKTKIYQFKLTCTTKKSFLTVFRSINDQNLPISNIKNIVKISRYFQIIVISRYFQMMQYIAFTIYRDIKRSSLVLNLSERRENSQGQDQGWAFCIAIYRECNILHHLEISQYCNIQKISWYFNDIFSVW